MLAPEFRVLCLVESHLVQAEVDPEHVLHVYEQGEQTSSVVPVSK